MARGAAIPMSATTYDIWVGGVQVTDDNKYDVLGTADGDGATVTYDPDTATLTIDGATINTVYEQTKTETEEFQYGIYVGIINLKMVVNGNSIINCPDATSKTSYGVYTVDKLEISGTGSLSANSGKGSVSYGIYSAGELTIKSGIITGISNAVYTSLGIYGDKIKISGGNVTANSTGMAATAMVANSYNITGGEIIATGKNGLSANYATYPINISGGEVNATGTDNAIKGVLNFDGGMVIAKGEKALDGTLNLISGIATADTSKDGNNAVSYDANNHASYKYLKVEPAPATPAPTVTDAKISISGASGTGGVYKIGDTVTSIWNNTALGDNNTNTIHSVTVNFSEFGGGTAVAATNSGDVWTATYIITAGSIDTTARNISVTATSAGGSTTTADTTNATVDNKKPTVSSVSVPGTGTYTTGQALDFTVNFSEAVEVTTVGGTPYLPLTVGSQTKQATYVSGSGTTALTFRYTVPADDSDSDGIGVNASLSTNGGTIQDGAGNNANLTLNSVGTTTGIRVDISAAPSITGQPSPQTVNEGQSATFLVTASGTGLTYQWQVNTGSGFTNITNGGVYSGANTSTLTITGVTAGMSGYQYRAIVSGTVEPVASSNSATLTVNAAPSHIITANPTTKDFSSLAVGYSAPAAQTVTITNTGNSSVTLTQPTCTNYTIGALSTTTLAAGGTATFIVTPKTGLAVGAHNETLTVSTNHSTNATVELSFSVTAAPSYIVTFNPNGGTVSETSRSVTSGTAVGTLSTPTRSGSYSFVGWYTAASGGTQISASTTVSENVIYYAHWTYTGGGGSGSGGGSSSNDNSSPVVAPPAADKPNSPTQGEIKVPATVDNQGNVTANITDKTVTDAFDKALADAKQNGNEQNGITVVLHVDAGSKTGSNVTVNLPKVVQDTIISKKIVNTIVVVDNPDIRIGMDLTTVQEINKQAKSDVNITATRGDSGKLTGEAKKVIGSRPVFDLKVNYGSGKQVQNFGTGSVSVTIPYILGANENAENVQAVYVDAKGKVHWLTNSVYDSVEKALRFSTNHFSTYGIGYKQTNTAFKDIAGHWAKEDIEFVVSRGLFSGTSESKFSPNAAMTRGMFVTALGRLANADVSDYAKSSFSDVKNHAYYMGYIQWASKNGIVNGVGGGKFAPNQSITREQMAVIMSNYAKTIGYTLPKVHVENIFADNGKISTYAKEAVKQMQMAGVISDKNSNLFDPQGTATRAEVSAVLRRFVELAISGDTAQGWFIIRGEAGFL